MECESPYANLIPGNRGKADCECFNPKVSNMSTISVRFCCFYSPVASTE